MKTIVVWAYLSSTSPVSHPTTHSPTSSVYRLIITPPCLSISSVCIQRVYPECVSSVCIEHLYNTSCIERSLADIAEIASQQSSGFANCRWQPQCSFKLLCLAICFSTTTTAKKKVKQLQAHYSIIHAV